MQPINLSKALKANKHIQKIADEREASLGQGFREDPLTAQQVALIESLIQANDFETRIPLADDFHRGTAYGIWKSITQTRDSTFSPVDAFSLCLNSLLCDDNHTVRTLTKWFMLESVVAQEKYIVDGLKNIAYYRENYDAVVFNKVNMLRDNHEGFISLESLKALGSLKLTEALIESAVRYEDLEAINYCLKHLVKPYERNDVLRKCLRIEGVSKAFTDMALRDHTSIEGFAKDVIATVKSGSLIQLERVYDAELAGRCHLELIDELMSDGYLSAEGIKAVQHFVSLVIDSGHDVYPVFVKRYFGKFAAIDQMDRPRLTPAQILDRIFARQQINSAASLDAFLPSVSIEDIHKHPNSGQLFDRLHAMTKKLSHLKHASNMHKGQHLSDELGL